MVILTKKKNNVLNLTDQNLARITNAYYCYVRQTEMTRWSEL